MEGKMKVLIVGGGGREHAIAWKLKQSKKVDKLYCAPGNGGIAQLATCLNVPATDLNGIIEAVKAHSIDFVVVAPDDPLAAGLVDMLEAEGIRAFGPSKAAAQIEASKSFAKNLMKKYGIPTAEYEVFMSYDEAVKALNGITYPIVIKADGLALGKGVLICEDHASAIEALKAMMIEHVFGTSGSRIVMEQFLTGPEVSLLVFTDGKTIKPMVSAQDHKRALDNDKGLNTGGMGAFAPTAKFTPQIRAWTIEHIVEPTVKAMAVEGRPFKGVLYFGLMITADGPKVIEYNARFGDPETQAVLPLLKTDLMDIFEAVVEERLDAQPVEFTGESAVCIVLASGGYPGIYAKGIEISGLDSLNGANDIMVFHAGTKLENGHIVTSGGRVLGITAKAWDMDSAIKKAYAAVESIYFDNMHYRRDIGRK